MSIPGAPASQNTAAAKPKTLEELANESFTQGRDDNAFQYLYAHYLTKDDAKIPFAWYKALKRPALGVRWGVGVEFVGAEDLQTEPYPVGKTQTMPQKGANRRGGPGGAGGAPGGAPGAPGGAGMGMPAMGGAGGPGGMGMPGMMGGAGGNNANGELQRLAGELATTTIEKLQDRVASGNYGEVLQAAPAMGASNSAGMGGMGGMMGMMPGGMGGPGGGPPGAPGGLGGPAPGAPGGAGGPGAAPAPRSARNSATPLMAGVNYIGIDKPSNLREKAQRLGMDVLFVFHVKASKNNKTSIVTNETYISVYAVEGEGDVAKLELAKGDKINNIAVQKAKAGDGGDESVDEMFDELFKAIDGKVKAEELPSVVTGDKIRQLRLPILLASPLENPLPALAEIRFYRTRDLISDEDALAAYTKILEDEEKAKTLATGSEEDRQKAIEKWLPNKGEKKS